MMRTAENLLADLDELRDRRRAGRISEDDYYAEWDRLWHLLHKAGRAKRQVANRQDNEERRLPKPNPCQGREPRPQVYCDGFYAPGQPLGIGVFSADVGIEISRQIDQPGTNNVAECLGAITALEECKTRGITGIRLLCDSQLVVYWTTGRYAWRSRTAHNYVPTIRRLLAEIGATIEWIPGKQNLADKYSRGLHDLPDNRSALERLKTIPLDRLAFKDLLALKSGRDEFSRMKKEKIIQLLDVEEWLKITAAFDKEKYQMSAARWRLRGLPVETAIRKVEVAREVGHRVAEKRNRWHEDWEDDDFEDVEEWDNGDDFEEDDS